MAKKTNTLKLDMMSVTVLLVMSIFGGIIGYYLGIGASAAQATAVHEAAILMRDKGTMMNEIGKLVETRAIRLGDKELINGAKSLMEGGSMLMGKATGMASFSQ